MSGRADVVCNACGGELRNWSRRDSNDDEAIYEGQCRDCSFYARVHEGDDGVTILMGGNWR